MAKDLEWESIHSSARKEKILCCEEEAMVGNEVSFRVARNAFGVHAKRGDHFLQADFSLPIACPDLDYFRFADNSVLFVGVTNFIPPVSTSSLAAGRHKRKNQLDR